MLLTGLLSLTACDTYGTFTLVEDSEEAESTFDEVKTKNEDAEDVESYEAVVDISGTMSSDAEETETFSTTMTQRIGLDETHIGTDLVMESNYGEYYYYTRYDSEEDKYFDYMKLNFTYVDEDEGTEVTVENNIVSENTTFDPDDVYDAEMISAETEMHMLASMEYSDEMNVYVSSNGYYKIENNEDDEMVSYIIDDEGYPIEMSATVDDITMKETIKYETTLDTVSTDEYEERDFEYTMSFFVYVLTYFSLSTGGIIENI